MTQEAALVDFRGMGAPHDTGAFLIPASIIVYQASFGGTVYVCAARQSERGWIPISYLPLTGDNATTVINTALASLTAGRTWKETVIVVGNYTGLGVITIHSYTTLVIQGSWKCKDNLNTHWILNSNPTGGNTFIEICGGKLDGNQVNQTGDVNVIHFKNVSQCCFYRLHIICSKRVTTANIPGVTYGGCGIQLITSSYCVIYACRIEQMMKDGVQCETDCYENIVCYCTFYTTVSYSCETCGVQFCIGGGYNIAAHNTINVSNLPYTDCLKIHGSNHNILIGNECRNANLYGIIVYCGNGDTSNNIITRNNIFNASGGAGPGIKLRGQSAAQHPRNVIDGNKIAGHLIGIFIDSEPDTAHAGVDDTYILNNIYKGANVAGENAIKIEHSHRCVVKGNIIYNCGTDVSAYAPILLLGDSDFTELKGNFCYFSVYSFRQAVLNNDYPNFTSWTDNFLYHTDTCNAGIFNGGTYHVCARNRAITPSGTLYGVSLDENTDYVWIFDNWWSAPIVVVNHLTAGNNIYVYHNRGWKTENIVLSSPFAVDAAGVVTVTIPHGLNVTPAKQDCHLTVVEETAVDDWRYGLLKVVSTDSTNVTCKIAITTPSGTSGATARLALLVITGLPNKPGGFVP